MLYVYMGLFAVGAVALDQLTKYLTIANIEIWEPVSLWDGVVGLTHVRNPGAAWSSFSGQQWLFALVFAVFTGLLLWEYFKKPMPFSKFERLCIFAIYGGGLGNMIDRVRLGYVVDMIQTLFMRFPIFNVADCFITCGCFALMGSLIFFNKEFWKEEKK